MENGVGIGDWSHLGEKNGVQDVGMELKADEIAVDGSDGSRDSEGDEVFEEATDAETPRVDVKDVPTKEDENAEKNWNLGDSLEVDGNFDAGHEIEKFQEAIGVASDVQNLAVEAPIVVHEKMEDLVRGEPFSEAAVVATIDEQSGPDKVVRDELNLSENDGLVDDGKDEAREIPDLGVDGEIEILKDGYEVSEKSDVVLEKSENGVLDNVNLDGTLVHENLDDTDVENQELQVHEELETGDANEVEGGDIDSPNHIEFNGENFLEVDKNVEVNETSSILDTGHQDNKNRELDDASAGPDDEYQADKVVESEGNLINTDTELKDYKTMELKEEVLTSQGQGHQDDKLEEQDTSANLDLVDQDDRTEELKDTSAPIESKHHEESSKPEDNLYTSVQERTLTLEVARPPSLEDTMVEKDEKIQASESDLGTENTRDSQPSLEDSMVKKDEEIQTSISDLGIENSKSSQPQSADASVEASSAIVDKLGKKEAKDEEVKQSTLGKGEQEIRPAENVSSSSIGKYTNSAPSPARPAGLGRAAPLLEPAPRVVQPRVNGTVSQMQSQPIEDPTNGEAEENDETREKLQMIRVKFLRLARRLGQTPHNVVVAQVLYRLGLAEQLRGRNGSRVAAFSFERASAMAEQLEAAGQEPLDFSCTIMVLGKSGVGKSATINSIFDENKFSTDAFQLGTKKVQDVVGTVHGIKVRVIDTPGLLLSSSDQHHNEKMLHSVKRFIQKSPPDIVLYLDRLDMQSRDFGDMPLLRTITDIFGPSIWFNAIVVLTHAASAPPEGPNGTATSYDMFVTQRSHVVQQAIRQAAGDMRLMNPVSLVENHSACRTNRAGQRVLPNGQVWKPHLLLLSFASKILAEANTLLKLQDSPPGKPFATRTRAPPLPFLLSTLLQSRPQLKLPQEQFGDDDDTLDGDLDESSDSDDESEYDELPPFKRLTKAQLSKLAKAQKKAYYDELEYREKLFMKKQLKEEKKRRKMMKKMAALAKDLPNDYSDNVEEESSGSASVPVPLPDLALPASFDSENPTHRYRSLDSFTNQWLVRPVLDSHGWDHDVGYEGINVERLFVVKDNIPVSFSGQVTKDKKDANLQMEVASSLKHGEGKATTLGFDMQTLGKDIAYTLRNETRFCNYRRNKATAGLSVTQIGDALTAGVKVEDKLIVNKRSQLVMSGGAIISRGDVAYGGSLEATLRDKDHPLGRFLSTIGLSVMDWHGDLVLGWNAQTQIPVGRSTNLIGRANLNNRGSGQVSIRLNSTEQLQIALICLVPLLNKLLGYSQSMQFGH